MLTFYHDCNGWPRARSTQPEASSQLEDFLPMDIQTAEAAEKLISWAFEVKCGHLTEYHFRGNAFRVKMLPDRVTINCAYTEDAAESVTLEQFITILEGWRDFLRCD